MIQNRAALRKRLIQLSYAEGFCFALMAGSAEAYVLVYAIRNGLSGAELGLLSQLPILIGALATLLLPGLISHRGLPKATNSAVAIQIVGLGLICLWAIQSQNFGLILIGLSLYWIGGQLSAPLWMDWISSWFPESQIRSFIGKRNAFVSVMTLLIFLANAKLFHWFNERTTFLLIFGLALTARLVSFVLFLLHPKPISRPGRTSTQSITSGDRSYLAPLGNSFLMGFIIFIVAFKFSVGIAAPFFAAFKIEGLQVTNTTYVYLTALPFLTRALAQQIVGMSQIRFPPLLVVFLSMVGVAIVSLLYAFADSTAALILPEILGGAAWAFFELALVLAVRAQTSGARRSLMGLIAAMGACALLLGGLVGGSLLDAHLEFADVFLLAAALRFLVAFTFLLFARRSLTDAPSVAQLGSFISSVLSIRPSLGAVGRVLPLRESALRKNSKAIEK